MYLVSVLQHEIFHEPQEPSKLKLKKNGSTTQGRRTERVSGKVAKVQKMNNIFPPDMLYDYEYDIMCLDCSESAWGDE